MALTISNEKSCSSMTSGTEYGDFHSEMKAIRIKTASAAPGPSTHARIDQSELAVLDVMLPDGMDLTCCGN